ncbi:MAG: 16S rRNA (uracil(1498)-N(3))-methyltransferase [Epsilonproteobacteria bacterium]|nr:16S rRNA (uracil(1498)-N(3))-methyltransferase [Campylobacterota bacterium]NPA63859.1 16S rRNA (uracil(1498)-N(3))-methyltransferase [Campylobacterota bacterium]
MQFVYHPASGKRSLRVDGEIYNYLLKVRRHKRGEIVPFRNMQDGYLYFYRIDEVSRREAILTLVHKEHKEVKPPRYLHLIWCLIDPKAIEKALPTLNELGVAKISFVYCDRSQKNFKLRFDKLKKILINSCQQCGRSDLMELETIKNIAEAMEEYNDILFLDFSDKTEKTFYNIQRVCIGPEGGFSDEERALFDRVTGLDTPMILRSESAAIAISAKVLV